MAAIPPAAFRKRWLMLAVGVLVGTVGCREKQAKVEEVAEQTKETRQEATPPPKPEDPQVIQQRALAETQAKLNVVLIADDGSFFPARGDIEVGSILYTVHQIGPDKVRYYSEDTVLVKREGAMFVIQPILDRPHPAGAPPQSYRSQQMRSAETKREEARQQKKITGAELAEKYAAREVK